MPMQAPSWHPPATCYVSSSPERYWECRCSNHQDLVKKAKGECRTLKRTGRVAKRFGSGPLRTTRRSSRSGKACDATFMRRRIYRLKSCCFKATTRRWRRSWPCPATGCRVSISHGTQTLPTYRPMSGAASGGPLAALGDLRNRTLALGSRDSGHGAILPVHFLEQQRLIEGRDYHTLRFDSDVGKHGDTGTSEVEVVRAVFDGRADAGAIGSPFWKALRSERLVPEGALNEIWTSPPYNHCMSTARPDLELAVQREFAEALSKMRYDNPIHRAVL